MKRFIDSVIWLVLIALLTWGWWPTDDAEAQVGPPNQVLCNGVPLQPVADIVTGTSAKLVPEVTGKIPFICGWHVTAVAASTFKFSYGTGANCATGNVQFTPTFNVSANAPSSDHVEFAHISVPVSQGVCVTVGGTGPVQAYLWFGQY